jgi:hypothetical protein
MTTRIALMAYLSILTGMRRWTSVPGVQAGTLLQCRFAPEMTGVEVLRT